jgi:hypothetical protein
VRKQDRTLTGLIVPAHATENEVVETMSGLIVPVSALKGAKQSVKIGDASAMGQLSALALQERGVQRGIRSYARKQRQRRRTKTARASRKRNR